MMMMMTICSGHRVSCSASTSTLSSRSSSKEEEEEEEEEEKKKTRRRGERGPGKKKRRFFCQLYFPLFFACLFFVNGVHAREKTEERTNGNDELLRKWLHSLQLRIPNESFSTFDDKIVTSLTDIQCQNFTTRDVKSSFSSNSIDGDDTDSTPSLHAHVIDFGASCSGAWTVSTSTNSKEVGGKVSAEVTNGDLQVDAEFVDRESDDDDTDNLKLVVDADDISDNKADDDDDDNIKNKYKLPKTVRFPKCSMQIEVDGLKKEEKQKIPASVLETNILIPSGVSFPFKLCCHV